MSWYNYIACFFAGVFLANAVPHFVHGISGDRFPAPFAHPPGRGLSSPTVNVVWALFNLVVGYILFGVGKVSSGEDSALVIFFAGLVVISTILSMRFATSPTPTDAVPIESPSFFPKPSKPPGSRAVAPGRSPGARTASAMLRTKPLALPVYQPHLRQPNPPFSLLGRLLVNHRLAFRLADITLEPLTHLRGELLISDEAAKVIGKLIVQYRLETLRPSD